MHFSQVSAVPKLLTTLYGGNEMIDLHSHSLLSDGVLIPSELARGAGLSEEEINILFENARQLVNKLKA